MSQKESQAEASNKTTAGAQVRNPYIMNFFKILVERKGEQADAEAIKKLMNDMYRIFEYMLGQNMTNALPEEIRKQYLTMSEDLRSLNYDKIGEVFDKHVPNYEQVMKETMKQFADIFMRNKAFDAQDYPVDFEKPSE